VPLEALKAGRPSRVVNVASTFAGDLDLDDLQFEHRPYDGMSAYAQSKACDRMLTWAFARRLLGDSVTVNAVAPGLVLDTSLYRHLPPGPGATSNATAAEVSRRGRTRSSGWPAAPSWTG
jgi:NAD(P)-dependent dehydrogenase (short-subunit alcohol dehydrogenase family)